MLRMFVKSNPLKLKDIAEMLNVESSSLSKIVRGGTYATHIFYDNLYTILENGGGIAPRRNDVTLYPCGCAKGSFEVWINEQFVCVLCFYNEFDILRFLNEEDGRLTLIKNFIPTEKVKFDNKIASRGKNWLFRK